MSRPKPKILMNHIDSKTYRSDQVLAAEGIYAVFYDGNPINLRTIKNSLIDISDKMNSPKYRKSSFSNAGHAHNLCEKLNKQFKTNKFTVILLTRGNIVTE